MKQGHVPFQHSSIMFQSQSSPGGYRADIDGIRALAVLSVFFFHLQPTLLPGGFLGVDVFFVISGYLITGIILRENHLRTFSFIHFYTRRVKRIFPALFVVLGLTAFVATFSLPPDAYDNFMTSARQIFSLPGRLAISMKGSPVNRCFTPGHSEWRSNSIFSGRC